MIRGSLMLPLISIQQLADLEVTRVSGTATTAVIEEVLLNFVVVTSNVYAVTTGTTTRNCLVALAGLDRHKNLVTSTPAPVTQLYTVRQQLSALSHQLVSTNLAHSIHVLLIQLHRSNK